MDWCFQEFDISWVNIFLKWISRGQYFIEMHVCGFFLTELFEGQPFIEKISLRFLESAVLLINVFFRIVHTKVGHFSVGWRFTGASYGTVK